MNRVPSSLEPILSENIGYTILLGVGLVMAVVVTLLVRVETKWLGTKKTSEWFYTAGRSVKTGLIASSVVSAWTWAATLLQSSSVAYQSGISGPFWYAGRSEYSDSSVFNTSSRAKTQGTFFPHISRDYPCSLW